MKKILVSCFSTILVLSSLTLNAQDPYQRPPKELVDLISAPSTPQVELAPSKDRILIVNQFGMPQLRDLAQEILFLAGERILPATHSQQVTKKIKSISVKALPGVKAQIAEGPITGLPDMPMLAYDASPDGKYLLMVVEQEDHLEIWIASFADLKARKIGEKALNGVLIGGVVWTPDGKSIIYPALPDGLTKPVISRIPKGPVVQTAEGKAAPVRTYQDLLKDDGDAALFEYYAMSEIIQLDIETGAEKVLAQKDMYSGMSLSPDGNWLMTVNLEKPFSYSVPYYNFASNTKVLNLADGTEVEVYRSPLMESIPFSRGSTRPGIRSISWRNDVPASLFWAYALDEGDARRKVAKRDELYTWEAPFTEKPKVFMRTDIRFSRMLWGDANHSFLMLSDAENSLEYTCLMDPSQATEEKTIKELFKFSREDRYNNPGNMYMAPNAMKRNVVWSSDGYKTLLLAGPGYGPEGARPFIDRYTIKTGETRRIWQSAADKYQNPAGYVDLKNMSFIYREESQTQWPNYVLYSVKSKKAQTITEFPNPYPSLAGVQTQVVEYTRADGVKLSGTLYLPAGYTKDQGPLPVFMWAYPAEFKSAQTAGQRSDSPNSYIRISPTSIIPFVSQGYAIFNNASFPIVGADGQEPNDTYIEQLVMNAEAAINVLVEMGVADRNRIAVGGHSYGSFMTANLLAHCDLFAAGIARSGAHNRTLTPFGFQNERRTFWEAQDVYTKMSPFFYADKLKTPILFIHGMADNNTGTFTMQSERMFAAVKGNGGTARLVLLPLESHGYAAEESVMHQAWETLQWLDKYVKNRKTE